MNQETWQYNLVSLDNVIDHVIGAKVIYHKNETIPMKIFSVLVLLKFRIVLLSKALLISWIVIMVKKILTFPCRQEGRQTKEAESLNNSMHSFVKVQRKNK